MAQSRATNRTLEGAFSTLSVTDLSSKEPHPPQAFNPFQEFFDALQNVNELQSLVQDQLLPTLRNQQSLKRISPDDPFFQHARDIWERENWDGEGLSNYITLMCGFLAFPVIMLLNPSGVDYLPWDEMVDESPTLTWLQQVLQPLGFTLKEIIIIDVFSLLTDWKMDNFPEDEKLRMVTEVFNLTDKFLRHFQPQIIISCQCSTKPSNDRWGIFDDPLALRLCSSVHGARNQKVVEIPLDDRTIHIVQGFHPRHIDLCTNPTERSDLDQVLCGIFEALYRPCADWKDRHRRACEKDLNNAAEQIRVTMAAFLDAIKVYRWHQRRAAVLGIITTQPTGFSRLKTNIRSWVASILPNTMSQ